MRRNDQMQRQATMRHRPCSTSLSITNATPVRVGRRAPTRHARSGFTLVEVLLVLAILGVIAAMVVPNLLGRQQEANVKVTRASINALDGALTQYAINNDGLYPEGAGAEVFNLLINPGQDKSGRPVAAYLAKMPTDAWGQPLNYEWPNSKVVNATKPAIWSNGANRQNEDGGGDDVNNWADGVAN